MRQRINRHQSPQGGGGFIPPQPPQQAQQPAQPVPPTTIVREAERSYAAPPPPPPPGQFVQPQPGQQIQGQPPLTMDAVFPNDPNLPPELRGRPVRDALDAYQTMRQDFLQRNGIRPPQQVPPTAPQPQGQQPQAQRPGQPPATNPRDSFFRDPEGAIKSAVDQAISGVMQQLQPVIQQTQQGSIERALQTVRSEFPDFSRYEGQIMGQLKNAPPEILANPESFRAAYRYVLGDEALRARQARPGQPQAPTWVPAGQQAPTAPAQQFFTESPTPHANVPTESGITPQVVEMARRFRMSPEEYVAWSGGNVPPAQGASNGRR